MQLLALFGSTLAILGGAVMLALAAIWTRDIVSLGELDAASRHTWRTLRQLMWFFIAGYLVAVVLQLFGETTLMAWVAAPVFLGGGMFVAMVVRAGRRSLAELDKITRAARISNDELRRSNAELEQFAYVASHDLQEPLRKVKAFGDLLRDTVGEKLEDDAKLYLDRMHNAAGRMSLLIEDLLEFSRVSRKEEKFAEADLDKIAREVLSDLETRIADVGGTVELSGLPTISGRPTQCRQLLQNLIGNALKFKHADRAPVVKVTGSLSKVGNEEWLELVVEDNGIGFEPQYADRIFGIFQRLHGRNEYQGTGIGLAICQKIALAHNGTIAAIGRPGQGASFVTKFPRWQKTEKA